MTSAQRETRPAAPAMRLARLRGNCLGAAALLIIQFGLGMTVNLYVALPRGESFFPVVFGAAPLAAHAVLALLLLGAAVGALARAIRCRTAIPLTALGLASVLAAGGAGASFAIGQSDGASLGMALATAVAMFCYLTAVFTLGERQASPPGGQRDQG